MTAWSHKIVLRTGSTLLLLCTALGALLAQPVWFLAPLAIIATLFLIQHPVTLFYLLLLSIPWSAEYNFPSGLGTDLPDEPLMLLTALSAVVLLFTKRCSFRYKRLHPLIFLLALQFFWLMLTVAFSTHFILSAKYLLAKSWYLIAFVAAPLIAWKDEKVLKRSAAILLFSMLLVTAVSMIRHAGMNFRFASINEALSPFFRNHVNYSALLVFMIPLQVVFLKQTTSKRLRFWIRLSFFISLPALYFSFARGAWLALFIGVIAYWLLQKGWLVRSFVLALLIVVAGLFWLKQDERYVAFSHDYQTTIFHEDFGEHLTATYQLKDMSTAERFHRWVAAIRMAEDSWQTGFGPTTFYQHYKSYTVPAFKTWVSRNKEQSTVHNYFLLLLIEQGALGLLLFLALLATAFWYAQKIYHQTNNVFWKRTVAAVAVHLAMQCTLNFLSDLIETDKVGSIFYLCIAALIIADNATRNKEKQSV